MNALTSHGCLGRAAAIVGLVALFAATGCERQAAPPDRASFAQAIIDEKGPLAPWGKAAGDLNGDGRPDLIVGGRAGGGLLWYENPSWRKQVIAAEGAFSTSIAVADIDADGRKDVVAVMHDRLVWFRNGGGDTWTMEEIDRLGLHDVRVADIDGDGRLDVVARGQSAFRNAGDKVFVYFREAPSGWQKKAIDVVHGEGIELADIDGDGRPDIVVNRSWLHNPGARDGAWEAYVYAAKWIWPHVYLALGDINGDGRADIAASPAETAGDRYRISWFEAPVDPKLPWVEHVVEHDVEAVHHFVGIADFDRDGRADIATAMMHQGEAPTEVRIYFNQGSGGAWAKQALSALGSHSMRIIDIDGDGDPDLFGANWDGDDQRPRLWVNQTCEPGKGCPCWRRHEIDRARPGDAVFVHAADLDADGKVDIAAGAWWYRNPGIPAGSWERRAVGDPAHDVALLADLDGDRDVDALATRWRSDKPDSRFVYAENDGKGNFALRTDLPAGTGDFLQGVALAPFVEDGTRQAALSWHRSRGTPEKGLQILTIPKSPAAEAWRLDPLAPTSQDEALSAGDIDRDGRLDLLLGTRWMHNGEDGWTSFVIDAESGNPPDRNRLADINADGRLDALVGVKAISSPGDVLWYEQGEDPRAPWKRHRIATVVGPMSLDVGDVDGDGDLDVVVGEHDLKSPQTARLIVFENLDGRGGEWREHLVHTGDEHHDGALLADVDGDGDLDIASIGWGHAKVVWYENLRSACAAPPNTVGAKSAERPKP